MVSDKSNARTGKDAAYGTLKINPTDAKDMQSFKWVNAAPSGAVSAGTMNHPKDKGGVVSSDIAYGKPPSASAKVSVTMIKEDADKKDKPPVGQISAKQKAATAAVDAKLAAELADKGNIAEIQAHLQDAAVAAVGKAPEGYSYDVAVALNPILDPGAGHPKSAKAVAYDPFTADGKRIVTISVPTDVEKLKGNNAAEEITKDETSSAKQTYNKEEKTDAHSDETTDYAHQ